MTMNNLIAKKNYLEALDIQPNKVRFKTWKTDNDSKIDSYLKILEKAQTSDPNFWLNCIHTFREQSNIFTKQENQALLAAVLLCLKKYVQKHLKTIKLSGGNR